MEDHQLHLKTQPAQLLNSGRFVNLYSIQGSWFVIDEQLNFTDHIARTARFCRYALLYNTRKIRPFPFGASYTNYYPSSCSIQKI